MQNKRRRITLKTVLILAACLALTAPVLAQVSATFDLSWHVIGSGGGRMESDQYTLQSTIGQPAVGTMGGSGHDLCSGFWCSGGTVQRRIYLPLVVRNFPTPGLIFADDFNHGTLSGWTANYGTWTNPGAYLRGEHTGNAWNIHSSTGSNIVYTGTVNLLSDNAVGLTFRSSADGRSSYDVILDAVDSVFKISKRSPTTYEILASHSMTVQHNHAYVVGVVANGSTIEAYLDGTKLLTTTDTTYSSGYLGVMLYHATATYDNLQAWQIP